MYLKKYIIIGIALLLWTSCAFAQESSSTAAAATGSTDAGAEKNIDPGEARKRSKFDYQLDKRPDPFVSFIKKEDEKKAQQDELVDEDTKEPLKEMQLFEPGQLRLVAVMGVQGSIVAMAEDMAGKGYVLKEKMLIGRHGQIVQIADSKVTIKETRRTKAGREITSDIVMSMKKEEEGK